MIYLGFLLFGIAGITVGLLQLREMLLYSRFALSDAEVSSSKVVVGRSNKGNAIYFPLIEYKYIVDGSEFVGSRYYSMQVLACSKRSAERLISKARKGATIRIRYNIKNPAKAFIINGPVLAVGLWLLVGLFQIGVAFWHFNDVGSAVENLFRRGIHFK